MRTYTPKPIAERVAKLRAERDAHLATKAASVKAWETAARDFIDKAAAMYRALGVEVKLTMESQSGIVYIEPTSVRKFHCMISLVDGDWLVGDRLEKTTVDAWIDNHIKVHVAGEPTPLPVYSEYEVVVRP